MACAARASPSEPTGLGMEIAFAYARAVWGLNIIHTPFTGLSNAHLCGPCTFSAIKLPLQYEIIALNGQTAIMA
jgi:hypothetical protein